MLPQKVLSKTEAMLPCTQMLTETMLPNNEVLRSEVVEPKEVAPLIEQRPPMYEAPNALKIAPPLMRSLAESPDPRRYEASDR